MSSNSSAVKVLLTGDVCGRFDTLFSRVGKVNGSNGPFDALICVGSFFNPDGDDAVGSLGELEPFVHGLKSVPVPTYFFSNFGAASTYSIEEIEKNPNCGIEYLGRRGVKKIKGLSVAFLSGMYSAAAYSSEDAGKQYYSSADIKYVIQEIDNMDGDLDLLLTVDWPEGILQGAADVPDEVVAKVSATMSGPCTELALAARPRYHVAGNAGLFWARQPYINSDRGAGKHVTRFIGMGNVGNSSKQKWIHALGLVPCSQMNVDQFATIPRDATPCPYTIRKRQAEYHQMEDEMGSQSWRWQDGAKRVRSAAAAPSLGRQDIVRDRSKTIFVRNVPFAASEEELIQFFSKAGTVVDIVRRANQEGKLNTYCHVQFETKEEMENACQLNESELMGRPMYIEPAGTDGRRKKDATPVEGCWFCLGNSNADVNLVCSVGEETYVALDKGAISDDHVLIVPVEHYACSLDLPDSTLHEVSRYLSALKSYYASKGKVMIGFERFMRLRKTGGNHCHINIIGISSQDAARAEEAFQQAGARQGHGFHKVEGTNDAQIKEKMTEVVGDGEYFAAILPDGSRLVHPIHYGERHPLSFGREVLAYLVGAPERSDWKQCKLSDAEELQRTERFKNSFKYYDIMFE